MKLYVCLFVSCLLDCLSVCLFECGRPFDWLLVCLLV